MAPGCWRDCSSPDGREVGVAGQEKYDRTTALKSGRPGRAIPAGRKPGGNLGSILVSQQDRENAQCLRRVFRAEFLRRIVIVDLPEDALSAMVKRPEVVFAVGIVAFGEVI